ncbi:MAG: GrpB family protein [Nanoarchaeota archaeon]|nr:GrpB family protein [Nanoarchaeota archaeon]
MGSKIFEHDKEIIEKIYLELVGRVKDSLNVDFEIKKIGSSFLGVKGKKDIDLVIMVSEGDFLEAKEQLSKVFGEAEKEDGDEWAKFEAKIEDYDIDLFLATGENERVRNDIYFFEALEKDKVLRDEYEKLKVENADDVDLYRKKKFEFYKRIVSRK